jgi:hypothetical protein
MQNNQNNLQENPKNLQEKPKVAKFQREIFLPTEDLILVNKETQVPD